MFRPNIRNYGLPGKYHSGPVQYPRSSAGLAGNIALRLMCIEVATPTLTLPS